MNTSQDEFTHGSGDTPPCIGFTSCALPEVKSTLSVENSNTGVSTLNCQNQTMQKDTEPHWHTIRCAYGKEKIAFEYFVKEGIKAFYPTITSSKTEEGKTVRKENSRLPNIFFAFGTFEELKQYVYDNVHNETKYIRFYYNQHHDGTKEPLIVPDRQMQSLIQICNSEVEDILLEPYVVEKFLKGQRVLVKEGPFAGVEGVVARFCGQQRVGISINGLLTIATAYIPTAFIEHINPTK